MEKSGTRETWYCVTHAYGYPVSAKEVRVSDVNKMTLSVHDDRSVRTRVPKSGKHASYFPTKSAAIAEMKAFLKSQQEIVSKSQRAIEEFSR